MPIAMPTGPARPVSKGPNFVPTVMIAEIPVATFPMTIRRGASAATTPAIMPMTVRICGSRFEMNPMILESAADTFSIAGARYAASWVPTFESAAAPVILMVSSASLNSFALSRVS